MTWRSRPREPRRGPSGLLAEDALITMIGQAHEAVNAARGSGQFPLLIGGHCPVILGALAALQAGPDQPGQLFVHAGRHVTAPRIAHRGGS